jgi:hypothetical protein
MTNQKLYEEISFIVNPSFMKYDYQYLNEAILNDNDILIEGLVDQVKQKLSRIFGLKAKLPAAIIGAVVMLSGASGLSAETKTKLQQKMSQGYSKNEILDLNTDDKRMQIKNVKPLQGYASGKKGFELKYSKAKLPFDWDSKTDLLYFVNVESSYGNYIAIKDYENNFLFIPKIISNFKPASVTNRSGQIPEIYVAGVLSNTNKWTRISRSFKINELSSRIQKYYSLLQAISQNELKRIEKFKENPKSFSTN